MTAPCYKCGKRTATCHADCKEYKNYDAENKKRLEKQMEENKQLAVEIERVFRAKKRRR